jgi:hypothetical protein
MPTTLSQPDIEAVPRTLETLTDLQTIARASFLGAVITAGRMRSGKLIKNERKQLGGLEERIRKYHVNGDYIFKAIIAESPEIHHLATGQKVAAIHSQDGRAWFEAVAREMERKVRT